MKNILILNEDDIKRTIADSYNVNLKDVELGHYTQLEGYGMDEHEEPYVEAVITVPVAAVRYIDIERE